MLVFRLFVRKDKKVYTCINCLLPSVILEWNKRANSKHQSKPRKHLLLIHVAWRSFKVKRGHIQYTDDEYWVFFHEWDRIISLLILKKRYFTSDINSVFKLKNIFFLFITFSLHFQFCDSTLRHNCLLYNNLIFSKCEIWFFSNVKITAGVILLLKIEFFKNCK